MDDLNIDTIEFAQKMDQKDSISYTRQQFFYPKAMSLPNVDKMRICPNNECIYLCGQSLGLMPISTVEYVNTYLNDWATLGVYGHFTGNMPWATCDKQCVPLMSSLVGGQCDEVVLMNQLSVNLHLMMTAFYQPTPNRYKILHEDRAFSSDLYVINSQIKLHGYDPEMSKVIMKPRSGLNYIRTQDLIQLLRTDGQSIALVLFSGIHYYTGQLFDIETITRIAHEQGCCIGWDLAHAVGNVPLRLHDWNVDFAVWCSYKYLNAGAGGIGGAFVHANHFNSNLMTLDGWWGNSSTTRFAMFDNFDRATGANGFRISNPSIHQCATLLPSLKIFAEVGMLQIRAKSILLTEYLEKLIKSKANTSKCYFEQLTPTDPEERGAQLSLRPCGLHAQALHDELEKSGVVVDVRDDVIRIAPIPLYNSFSDVFHFVTLLNDAVERLTNT